MKKILTSCLLAALVAIFPMTVSDAISVNADGKAEIAMELDRGTVLFSKNADTRLPMASTTKIMTALLVCEDCDLTEVITVPDCAVGAEGSSVYLRKDERISVKDLLYGLMLRSGNDAACALAVHHSGSMEKFAEDMNEKASELGAKDTHFCNPSGLPDENHYTTARDLCNIARAAMSNPIFAQVVSTKHYQGDFRNFTNKNKILTSLEGANGVKTGYTVKAGRCLVSSAKRGNMDIVCVVLNCYDMYERSAEIINRSFEKYAVETLSTETVFRYGSSLCRLKDDLPVCVAKGGELVYKTVPIDVGAPRGAVAKLEIYSENNLILSEFLYSIMSD